MCLALRCFASAGDRAHSASPTTRAPTMAPLSGGQGPGSQARASLPLASGTSSPPHQGIKEHFTCCKGTWSRCVQAYRDLLRAEITHKQRLAHPTPARCNIERRATCLRGASHGATSRTGGHVQTKEDMHAAAHGEDAGRASRLPGASHGAALLLLTAHQAGRRPGTWTPLASEKHRRASRVQPLPRSLPHGVSVQR